MVRELADDGFDVAVTCRVLNVRRQGYYEWRSGAKSARAQNNELLLKHIQGLYRRRRGGATRRDPHADPYPDLVDRQFAVDGPDQLWLSMT